MSIVLIGMSNLGKSLWARRLEEAAGYTRVCVDDEIERRLGPYLVSQGFQGIADVSKWMGQPFDERYAKNSALYLKHEKAVMWEATKRILKGEKLVVDTTGSVIYVGWPILLLLWLFSTIVLLDAPESHQAELYRKYIAEPKPVLWGDHTYRPYWGEGSMVALARCYLNLLKARNRRYHRWGHVTLEYNELRLPGFDVHRFLWSAFQE